VPTAGVSDPGTRPDPATVTSLVRRLRELSRWRGAQQFEIDELLLEAAEQIAILSPVKDATERSTKPDEPRPAAPSRLEASSRAAQRSSIWFPQPGASAALGNARSAPNDEKAFLTLPALIAHAIDHPGQKAIRVETVVPRDPLELLEGSAKDGPAGYEIRLPVEPILVPEPEPSEITSPDNVTLLYPPCSSAESRFAPEHSQLTRPDVPALSVAAPDVSGMPSSPPSSPDHALLSSLSAQSLLPVQSDVQAADALASPAVGSKAAEANVPVPVVVHPGTGSGTSVRIHSTSGKRVHPRFDLPFSVDIAGASYPGTNLSLGGVGLAGPSLSTALGEVFKAAVRFSFPTHEIRVAANLAVVRLDQSQRAVAFQFLNLNVDTARLFQSITDKWASGDLASLDTAIDPDGSGQALSLSGKSIRTLRILGLSMRYGVALSGVALAAWLLGTLLYDRWFSIVPEHAVVTSDILQIQAPNSGYYRERVPVGARLKVDDEIGLLTPITPSAPRMEWQLRLANLKIRLEGQKATLERAKAASASMVRTLTAERERAQAEQRSLTDQIMDQHKMLDTIRADVKRGKVTSAHLASESARLSQLERLLVQSQTADALFDEQLRAAELGLFAAARPSAERAPVEVERELRQTAAEIQVLEQTLATVPEATSLRSPCDCLLSESRRDGEYVEAGTGLATLTPVQESQDAMRGQVDALVPHAQAQAIATGDPVEIRDGGTSEPMAGHVVAISFDPTSKNRAGLPINLLSSGRFARVTIAFSARDGQAVPNLGTPVQVRFQSGLHSGVSLPRILGTILDSIPFVANSSETPSP
jgi:multidrug resistance efflux pump